MISISIITVNLNNNKGLIKTINSVEQQDYINYQHIIIDGDSKDGSKDTLSKISNKNTIWISEDDSGIYNAMNKGIKLSQGDYLIFLNSGDYFFHDRVLLNFDKNKFTQDIVYGNVFFESSKKILGYDEELRFSFFFNSSLAHQSTFFRREVFDMVGLYDEEYKIVSDWGFYLKAFGRFNVSYKYFNEIISIFNQEGISSTQIELCDKERYLFLENEFPFFIEDYKQYSQLEKKVNAFDNSRLIQLVFSIKSTKVYFVLRSSLYNVFNFIRHK